jgi:hypothetical protein
MSNNNKTTTTGASAAQADPELIAFFAASILELSQKPFVNAARRANAPAPWADPLHCGMCNVEVTNAENKGGCNCGDNDVLCQGCGEWCECAEEWCCGVGLCQIVPAGDSDDEEEPM